MVFMMVLLFYSLSLTLHISSILAEHALCIIFCIFNLGEMQLSNLPRKGDLIPCRAREIQIPCKHIPTTLIREEFLAGNDGS